MVNRNLIYWLILLCMIVGAVEAFSFLTLSLLESRYHMEYKPHACTLNTHHKEILKGYNEDPLQYRFAMHPTLGWALQDRDTNTLGGRKGTDYNAKPSEGSVRIATFGDSFTYSDDVADDQTWEYIMETLNPRVEVPNFGVGGYGLDQAYLSYKEKADSLNADIVLIGYFPFDARRNVNTFRPFIYSKSSIPLAKPRFVIEDDKLIKVPQAFSSIEDYNALLDDEKALLPTATEHDFFCRYRYDAYPLDFLSSIRLFAILRNYVFVDYHSIIEENVLNPDSEAFAVTTKIFESFYNDVLSNGDIPVIVLFPHILDIYNTRGDSVSSYSSLLPFFEENHYTYIDLADAFALPENLYDPFDLFQDHFTPLGNRIAATYILQQLSEKDILQN